MRAILVLGFLVSLAACSGGPGAYGITGPGTQPAPTVPTVDTPEAAPAPGVTTWGTPYGPTNAPTTGSSGFWGYN